MVFAGFGGQVCFQFEIELCSGKPIVLTTDLDIFCWFNRAEAEIKYTNYLTSHFCVDMYVSYSQDQRDLPFVVYPLQDGPEIYRDYEQCYEQFLCP